MWSNRERFSMLLINQDDIKKEGFAVERPQSWMSGFPLFLYGYGTTLCMRIFLHIESQALTRENCWERSLKRTGSRASLTHYRIVRSEGKASRSHLNSFSEACSSLRLSASRNVLGNDLLQICSPECAFGSKWWVGIGLGLIDSLSPAHTESMNFGYTELRLTCS